MVEYCYYYFDIIRIYAEVFETNKSSMRVLEKNGFYLEGVRRKAVYKNAVLMDDYIWVKLRHS
jgi:RimJ/RimL family protein N-acetyltransferase